MNNATVNVRVLRDMLDNLVQRGLGNAPVMFGMRTEHHVFASSIHSSQLRGSTDDIGLWIFGSADNEMDDVACEICELVVPDRMPLVSWDKLIAYWNGDGPQPQPEEW